MFFIFFFPFFCLSRSLFLRVTSPPYRPEITSLRKGLIVSRAITFPPSAACTGMTKFWRGIAPLIFPQPFCLPDEPIPWGRCAKALLLFLQLANIHLYQIRFSISDNFIAHGRVSGRNAFEVVMEVDDDVSEWDFKRKEYPLQIDIFSIEIGGAQRSQ